MPLALQQPLRMRNKKQAKPGSSAGHLAASVELQQNFLQMLRQSYIENVFFWFVLKGFSEHGITLPAACPPAFCR